MHENKKWISCENEADARALASTLELTCKSQRDELNVSSIPALERVVQTHKRYGINTPASRRLADHLNRLKEKKQSS